LADFKLQAQQLVIGFFSCYLNNELWSLVNTLKVDLISHGAHYNYSLQENLR